MYNSQLPIFIQVADSGSFAKAGERLFLTPTAVMKQINQFEERVGTPLLVRNNRGVTLTPAGEAVYRDARAMMDYSARAIRRARRLGGAESFVVRVGTSFLNPCRKLMELWGEISESHPEFKIRVVPFEDDRKNILATLDSLGREFDMIVGVCDSREWFKRCRFFPLGEKRFCCTMSRRHRLAGREQLTWADLHGERLMMVARGDSPLNDAIRSVLETEHPQVEIEDVLYCYDMEMFNRCEQTGALLLTLEGWEDLHPSLQTVPLEWEERMPYGLLYARSPSHDVREFLKAVTEVKGG